MPEYLVEFPVKGGGHLVVAADRHDLLGLLGPESDLVSAAPNAGAVIERVRTTLNDALGELGTALDAIGAQMERMTADEWSVKFGLKVGGEAGLFVTKGTVEANFEISATWKRGSTT